MDSEDKSVALSWMGKFAIQGDAPAVQGELRFHPRFGIQVRTLELVDEVRVDRELRRHPTLHGVIEGGRRCTILEAFETEVAGGGVETRHIVGNAILLDVHGVEPSLPAYRRLRFTSPAYTALVHPRGIRPGPSMPVARGRKIATAAARPVEGAWNGHTLRCASILDAPSYQGDDGTYRIVEQPYFEIHFSAPQTFDEVRRIVAAVELISCLGEGRFSGPPTLTLWTNPERRRGSRGKSNLSAPCTVLFAQDWYRQVEARHPMERLFLLQHLGELAPAILARWLDLSRRVERQTSLFRASGAILDVETKFLFLIQAVEGMHRELDGRLELDQSEFDRGLEALQKAIPDNLSATAKEVFRNRLRLTNEPGLGSRLREYGERVQRVIPGALAGFNKDRSAIAKLRNGMSHALRRDEKTNAEHFVQHHVYYCELLRVLFIFSLIEHLGVSDEAMRKIFQREFKILAWRRADAGLSFQDKSFTD